MRARGLHATQKQEKRENEREFMLDFSQNHIHFILDITEDNSVILDNFSYNRHTDSRPKKGCWCNIAEVQVCGENPDDHHFAKHTGSSGSKSLKYLSHTYYENGDGNKLEVVLTDGKMQVTQHYQFYNGLDVVRAWTVVKNVSDAPLGLEYVASFAYTGFDDGEGSVEDKIRVLLPHNAWYKEVNWREYSLFDLGYEKRHVFSGKRVAVSNTGTWSSKEYLPMGAIRNLATENTILWQIEHNGSWHWEISDIYDMMYFKLSGPTEQENHWYKELKAGESFESVKVCLSVGADFDGALAQMTNYRRRIVKTSEADRGLPVIFNDYMNCLGGDPTEEKLLPIIDKAAEVGAEYYCIDAGWYGVGDWWDSVGEWMPCQERFPHGLQFVLDYIRSKGMIPGIWLEIEVVGIRSPLAAQLEDECFFMRHGKRVIDHGRYQLDFRNEKVRAHATAVIDRVVGEYGVRYIKNDYNIDAGVGTEVNADSFGDGLMGHNRAYLAWIGEMKAKYPDLVWENCASGGMRMEYASLALAEVQSSSDQTDYRYNANVAAAIATAVLPEQAAVWAYPKANDGENAVVMNMINAMLQRIHLSGEIYGWSDKQLAIVKEGVDCYKRIRSDIPKSIPFYPCGIPQYSDGWLCAGYRFDGCARFAVWRMDSENNSLEIPLDAIGDVEVLYPSNHNAKLEKTLLGLCVTLPERYSAILFQIQYKSC